MASSTGSNNTVPIKKRFPKDQNNNKNGSDEKQQEKPSPILSLTKNAITPLAFLSPTPPTSEAVVGATSGTLISSNASATLGGIPRNVNVAPSLLQKRSYDVFSGGSHILQPGNVQLLNVPHTLNFPRNGEYLVRSGKDVHSPKSLVGYMRSQPSHNKEGAYESADIQPLKEVAKDKGKKQVASQEKEEAAAEPSPTRRNNVNVPGLKLVDNRKKYRVPDLNFPPPEND
ncbi:hypothetical protein A4A49_25846 [Nicotiana attenuata]|uniref:Uncharacterized protein n=1 Tax=Nicotiana attenuata TaxID=49451 RepID=A0A1J6KDX4_NICAT|nr:hypothetical protein A4A49_25846 [Nicotiana attenuata]